jgi:type 1 fimbriae regulatory protein FimB
MLQSPPRKIPFSERRDREFLYLPEVDALIAALSQTRSPIRNSSLALLLFCQALQPVELCWLRWCDLNFAEKTLVVVRNRLKPSSYQPQVVVNLQLLCPAEIDILQRLYQQRTSDWIFTSERKQRLSERSLHHLIQHAGELAKLPLTVHPYMLRRSGIYYRAALLLQPLNLSLRQCCLLWNWHTTNIPFSTTAAQEYRAIEPEQESAFFIALEQIKTFTGIKLDQNVIDYILGAFLLFPRLKEIPRDYWLAPSGWQTPNFAENTQVTFLSLTD